MVKKIGYIGQLVDNYMDRNSISLDSFSIDGNDEFVTITVKGLFSSATFGKGIRLINYINSLLFQFKSPLYQMQISSIDRGDQTPIEDEQIDEVSLILPADKFKEVNHRMDVYLGSR
jgi:hypothetical protein